MLYLSDRVPANADGQPLPIRRTPISGAIVATITTPSFVGTNTHFWGGRTTPCTPPNCDACDSGCPFRWHAYIAAIEFAKNSQFLFECTSSAAEQLEAYIRDHGTLRGCTFRASRASKRQNARVIIETHPYTGKGTDIPRAPDLPKVLARLWNIPINQILTPNASTATPPDVAPTDRFTERMQAAAAKPNGDQP